MNIEELQEIKDLSNQAMKGRKRLSKLHDNYIKASNSGNLSRAKTTTYNARTHSIMFYDVEPAEKALKAILKRYI